MIARSYHCHHAKTLTTWTALFRQLSSWHDCRNPPLPPCHDTNNLNCIIWQLSSWHDCKILPLPPWHDTNHLNCIFSTTEFTAWLQDPTSAIMPWHLQPKLHYFNNWVHSMIARSHHCHHAMTLTTRTAYFRQLSSWHDCKIPPLSPCHDTNNLNCVIPHIYPMVDKF